MATLRFSIVGAADPTRNEATHDHPYSPPVRIQETRNIARALDIELAKRGHGLIVCDARFIEADTVAGYAATYGKPTGAERPILIRQPYDEALQRFGEETAHPTLFERQADKTGFWEASFYRSLIDSDGVILLGAGASTSIAGQVAIGARIPLLALERTGGAASKVWRTIAPVIDLPIIDEHARMALDLSADDVDAWVDALETQRRRRYSVESGPIRRHAAWASAFSIGALVTALGGCLIPSLADATRMALLLAAMPQAGAAGAANCMAFEGRCGSGPRVTPSLAVTLALGAMSGALAGLLYVLSQPATIALTGDAGLRLAAIVTVVSTIGGLTAETIFRKLLGIDVLQTRGIGVSGNPPRSGGSNPQ